MVQWLKVLAVLPEDQGSLPMICPHSVLQCVSNSTSLHHLLTSMGTRNTSVVQTYAQSIIHTY